MYFIFSLLNEIHFLKKNLIGFTSQQKRKLQATKLDFVGLNQLFIIICDGLHLLTM
jgi:hypothetical protein